ncbi:aldehyde dehydrogenase family protein [Gemmatimonadota bacterium]
MMTRNDHLLKLLPDPDQEYGSWIMGEEFPQGRPTEVINPGTGDTLGRILVGGTEVGEIAVEAAVRAFPVWRNLSFYQRGRCLEKFARLIVSYQEKLVDLIAREQGKPVAESYAIELLVSADFWRHLSRYAQRILEAEKTVFRNPMLTGRKGEIRFEPAGPTMFITPWNYPLLTPALQVAQALAVGNSVILKPSLVTPFSALAIQWMAEEAGVPPGVVNTVLISDEAAASVIQHPEIARIGYAGGEYSGRKIMRSAAEAMKPVNLDIRGKNAAIVAADCNLERTAVGVAWWGLSNAGQIRLGIERVYVEREIEAAFLERLATVCNSLRLGNPARSSTDIGPMTLSEERERVHEHVVDAIARGAEVLSGGAKPEGPGYFYPATLLSDVTHEMRVMRDITFGPVLPVVAVDSLEEAVELTNQSRNSLTASIWSENREKANQVADRLQAGMVGINDHASGYVEPSACCGGEGFGGIGRGHGQHKLATLCRIKHVSYEYHATSAAWWFPYSRDLRNFLRTTLGAIHKRGAIRKFNRLRRLLTMRHFRRATRFSSLVRRWRSLF